MGEVTGRLIGSRARWFIDIGTSMRMGGERWRSIWEFRRRIDAVAFARRKGIRLETE